MFDRDTVILLAILAVNLALVSALLWMRLRASGQERLAPRLIAETWLTFIVAFLFFRAMQQMLPEAPLTERGFLAGLGRSAEAFLALGPASKAWFIGGGAAAVALLIHLIVSINRACSAPLKGDL